MTVLCTSCGVMVEARSQIVAADDSERATNEAAEFGGLLHAMIMHRLQDHPEDSSVNEVMAAAGQVEAARYFRGSESSGFEGLRLRYVESVRDRLAAAPVVGAGLARSNGSIQ